jgi:NitT/TauT family transport system permease protein
MIKKVINIPNLLFLILMALVLLPGKKEAENAIPFILVILFVQTWFTVLNVGSRSKKYMSDIVCAIYIFFILWETTTKTLDIANKILVPPPENVFYVFVTQRKLMLEGLVSSMRLLLTGFSLALLVGISLGLFVGWIPRLRHAVLPIVKVISPIPPLIYTPYVIAVMPTFRSASIFVIFLGVFWPTFMNMINRVGDIDKKLIDSAKSLNVKTHTMLFKIILPYSIPGIIGGLTVSLSTSFMTLTLAEMIGAKSGLGFFVKKFSDYGDYTKVIAGIIFIGVVVTILNFFISVIKKKTLKWKGEENGH